MVGVLHRASAVVPVGPVSHHCLRAVEVTGVAIEVTFFLSGDCAARRFRADDDVAAVLRLRMDFVLLIWEQSLAQICALVSRTAPTGTRQIPLDD